MTVVIKKYALNLKTFFLHQVKLNLYHNLIIYQRKADMSEAFKNSFDNQLITCRTCILPRNNSFQILSFQTKAKIVSFLVVFVERKKQPSEDYDRPEYA